MSVVDPVPALDTDAPVVPAKAFILAVTAAGVLSPSRAIR